MTDVELYQPAPVSEHELDVILRQADMLAKSDIIPRDYRGKPANIIAASLTGRTFGWDAMTAMRNGHVIEGTWTIKPEAMLALVRQAGHSVTGETSPTGATVRGKRGDTGDDMTVSFTLDDAVRARLCTMQDGKTFARSERGKVLPWEAYPQAMCWARAVSQLCRMLFPDVTLGLSLTAEEMGAVVDDAGDVIDLPAPDVAALSGNSDERPISAANAAVLVARCEEIGVDVATAVLAGTHNRTDDPAEVLIGEVRQVKEALEFLGAEVSDLDGEPA
jgi:hypothetical protein